MSYIVILRDQHGGFVPMICDDYGIQLSVFETFDEAENAICNNLLGRACGGVVINLDEDGIDV